MLVIFTFDGQPSTCGLITEVMAHPRYRDDCASPWTGPCGDVHGPYRLQALPAEGFQPCSAATAISTLTEWPATNLSPWVSASLLLSREIVGAWVSPFIVEADELYRLSVAREGNEHEYGRVVGLAGFHEFIAIDRNNGAITVIIATDD
jgi:hypothetical protein